MDNKGYIHLYTGNGKGKTTAAFGLAVRALCSGRKVFVGQFVKSMKYNETRIVEKFDGIRIEQLGRGCFITRSPQEEDILMAHEGLERCRSVMASGAWDVVILDELCIAIWANLLTTDEVLAALRDRDPQIEVVITGRYAPEELIAAADLVTEMREVKHYYSAGILSRDGIDR